MSGEKTEQPTDHRLRKAREDGQVAKSKDFTQTLLLGALFGYTLIDSENIMKRMVEIMVAPSDVYGMSFRGAVSILVSRSLEITLWLVMPYVLIVLMVAACRDACRPGCCSRSRC